MERFYSKTQPLGDCLIWTASKYPNGYGAFKFNGKTTSAHRVSYILKNGSIPDGMLICHTCDVRACVKPEHLFVGSYSDNMKDCRDKGRLIIPPPPKKKPIVHGTEHAYRGRGCRCDPCKSNYSKIRRAKWLRTGK